MRIEFALAERMFVLEQDILQAVVSACIITLDQSQKLETLLALISACQEEKFL